MSKQMQIVNGAEMISRGAMDAGVNFFAGYPITPASSVYTSLLTKLQMQGKIAVGSSDEISGIAMCLGASIRGAKAMSATAAPGLSLMIENLGYAFATETPFVLVLGQRLGPSTGAATQTAEGDILMAANNISGGYRIPVIAPNSIHNCYESTIRAINISEKYRTPVILLTEKDIIMSTTNIDPETIPKVEIVERKAFQGKVGDVYHTYDFGNEYAGVPDFVRPGEDPFQVRVTASLHDKKGNLTKNDPEAFEVLEHLRAKIEDNADEMAVYETDFDAGADICVISFLATDLAARQAIKAARKDGVKVKHLTLQSLIPVPKKAIEKAIAGCSIVVVPEENIQGQYESLIHYLIADKEVRKVNYQGGLLPPQMILDAITGKTKGTVSPKKSKELAST